MSDSTREIAADLRRSAEELSQGQAKVGLKRIFLGPNALDRLRSEVDSVAGSGPVVILEDRTPMRRSDDDLKQLVEQLLDGRSGVKRVSLGMDHEQLHADESTLAEARALVVGASCVVTVGSGTITDIGKDACHSNGGTPLVVIQTAPSVNGYSDDMAVILKDGAKRTTPSIWPTTLLIDTQILQGAPQSLIASGYAEMMAMFTAPADWKLAQLVGLDESYREAIVDMFRPMGPQLLSSAPGIAARESDAIELLATLLTYTGVAMGIAGRTAPLSGTEHLISHLIDMSAPAEGVPTGLHGAQVGVGAVIAAVIWKRAVKQVTPDKLIRRSVDRTRAEAAVGDAFGRLDDTGAMAAECWTDYQSKLTRWESASIRDDNANQLVDRLTDLASEIVEPGAIIDALSTAGAPTRFSELDPPVSRDRVRWVVGSAPLMRDRFTIIDLAALTGGWTATDVEEVLDEAAELGGGW